MTVLDGVRKRGTDHSSATVPRVLGNESLRLTHSISSPKKSQSFRKRDKKRKEQKTQTELSGWLDSPAPEWNLIEKPRTPTGAQVATLKIAGRSIASWEALKDHTREDPDMKDLYAHLMDPIASPLLKESTRKQKRVYELNKEQGLLMYKGDTSDGVIENEELWRIYIPRSMRRTAMALVHCLPMGAHMGRDRMRKLMKEKFFWPGMNTEIAQFVKCCPSCQIAKSPKPLKQGILTEYPLVLEAWDTLHIDHVGPLSESKQGFKHILTIIDRGTNFVMAIPVKDLKASTQARVLYQEVFCKFGIPRKIISDRGNRVQKRVHKRVPRQKTRYQMDILLVPKPSSQWKN